MKPEPLSMIWKSRVIREGEGQVRIVADEPVSTMTRKQAAKVLGVSAWSVAEFFRLGLIQGHKPGAVRVRSDGRASNARLVLDAASVLEFDRKQKASKGA